MGKQSNRKKLNRINRQRSIAAATALWDLAANRQNPNAIRILLEMIGLAKIASYLMAAGDRAIDAEAVREIAGAIERSALRS